MQKSKFEKLNKIILSMVGFLLVVVVIVSVQTSALGVELSHLEQKQKELLSQKVVLEDSWAQNISLKNAQGLAKKYRFTQDYEVVYLNSTDAFAQLPGR